MTCRYVKDGLVAVIYSPGFGTGWSQANTKDVWFGDVSAPSQDELLFDATLAEMIDRGDPYDALEAYVTDKWGEDGNWLGLIYAKLAWLVPGTQFIIHEYDGAESIVMAADVVVTA